VPRWASLAIKAETGGDLELAHIEADTLLCDLLEQLGYRKTVEAYDSIEKWYA
jgi:hypothetical protein